MVRQRCVNAGIERSEGCQVCGVPLVDVRSDRTTCSDRCRQRRRRDFRLQLSVTTLMLAPMRIELANLSRAEVSELLGMQPKQVRELEFSADFPRPVMLTPLAPRWCRGEVLEWQASQQQAKKEAR